MLNEDLIAAYEATNYRVLSDPEFSLKIDEPCLELLRVYDSTSTDSATFITAWNPFSEEKSKHENYRENELLCEDLNAIGATVLPGFGAWPDDPTKGEDSFLALGISETEAKSLGKKYKQNAIVFVSGDAIPRLIILVQAT